MFADDVRVDGRNGRSMVTHDGLRCTYLLAKQIKVKVHTSDRGMTAINDSVKLMPYRVDVKSSTVDTVYDVTITDSNGTNNYGGIDECVVVRHEWCTEAMTKYEWSTRLALAVELNIATNRILIPHSAGGPAFGRLSQGQCDSL